MNVTSELIFLNIWWRRGYQQVPAVPFWWRSPGSGCHSWWCEEDSWAQCWPVSGSRGSRRRCTAGSSCPPLRAAGCRSHGQSPPELGLRLVTDKTLKPWHSIERCNPSFQFLKLTKITVKWTKIELVYFAEIKMTAKPSKDHFNNCSLLSVMVTVYILSFLINCESYSSFVICAHGKL